MVLGDEHDVARAGFLEEARPALRLPLRQLALEELPDHPEGELALEFAAAGREHVHGFLRAAPGLGEQSALTDPRGALHDYQAPLAGGGALDLRVELVKLAPALE